MICSGCGYENQGGNRFCGMCGMPLPHRPLTAPGAHGTHTFTRVPLENGKPGRARVGSRPEETSPAAPQSRGVLIAMPGPERPIQDSISPKRDMVPQVSLDEYVKNFHYVPPADPGETTMHGGTQALQTQGSEVRDAPPTIPTEVTTDTEDVDKRLGLEGLAPDDERRDRPRFLDFNEPSVLPETPEPPVPAIAGPSFLGLGDAAAVAAASTDGKEAAEPHGRAWTWVAVAALLVFVSLGVLEWRSQVNETNYGPVEVVKTKIGNIWHGSSPAPRAPGTAEGDAAKPVMQVEEQPKPKAQELGIAATASASSSTTAGSPPASAANAAGSAASPLQSAPLAETQPPAAQKTASSIPGASVNATQAAPEPKASQPKAMPSSNGSKAVITDTPQTAAATPKPRAQADDLAIPAKKPVPGQEEVAKANDASDAAAAAAWLWKATAKGNPEAPVRLANMYVKGDGVPRSCEQALVLLRAAADKGNAQARARLAQINSSGACAQRNR